MAKISRRHEATAKAYQSIHYFFDLYFLRYATDQLEGLIEGAAATSMYRMNRPANLLYYTRQLEALCDAAFIICSVKGNENIAAIPLPEKLSLPRIEQYNNYMPPKTKMLPWEFFPWHLNWNEYHTPYIAVKRFVNAMPKISWYKIIYEVLEAALSEQSICEHCPAAKLLLVRKQLLVLIEAFHLIEVRYLKKHLVDPN